jgi:DNA-binding LacI/PurR family transcriptional regulator
MGVDDHEFSRVVDLTTIHQPVADHGSAAARMLIAAMTEIERLAATDDPAGDTAPSATEPFRPTLTLIERSTTGPPST